MSKINKFCIECDFPKTKKDPIREIYLCDLCAMSDKYRLIY